MDDALLERAQARVGTTLKERYHVDSVLGVGGMAVVYAVTHRNKKRFAIKMLHPELTLNADVKKRFLREGYVANSVEHPGAVAVLDDDVAPDGAPFIVMELLDGAGLEQLWEKSGGHMPLERVLAVADQLLDVLAAAHAKEVVHRDLKPANLFVQRDGTVKVLDFGIARLREAVSGDAAAGTQTGALMGTPAFLPPEQAGGRTREIDGQTDLWAVGATMFTLLTGEPVHSGENATQMVIAAATKPARPVGTVVPVPEPVATAIDKALAFDKAVRWSSASEMRQALRAACQQAFGRPPSRETLESFFSEKPVEKAVGGRTEPLRRTPALPVAATMPVPGASGPHIASAIGGTTAKPVSSEPVPSSVVPKSDKSRLAVLAAGALVVAGIVGFGWRLAGKKSDAESAAARPAPTETAKITPEAPVLPSATAAVRAETPAATTLPSAAITTTPQAHDKPRPTPVTHPVAPAVSAAPSAALTPSAPVCEYQKYVDADGNPQVKKVCK